MSKPVHLASFDYDSDATILMHHLSQLVHPNAQKIKSVSMVSIYGIARSPLFPLGKIVTTDAAAALLQQTNTELILLLLRHQCGACDDIAAIDGNATALATDSCIRSVYLLGEQKQPLWIVTSGERNTTTAMLPPEYQS